MVNKLITTTGKMAAKKVASKTAEKIFDTYGYVADRTGIGSKSLDAGEEDTLKCYQAMPYDTTGFCKAVGNKARYDYHHPWKSKRK